MRAAMAEHDYSRAKEVLEPYADKDWVPVVRLRCAIAAGLKADKVEAAQHVLASRPGQGPQLDAAQVLLDLDEFDGAARGGRDVARDVGASASQLARGHHIWLRALSAQDKWDQTIEIYDRWETNHPTHPHMQAWYVRVSRRRPGSGSEAS